MIIVTGGTGLLGSHLLFELSKDNNELIALYRNDLKIDEVEKLFKYYDAINGVDRFQRITWKKCDILDVVALSEIFSEGDKIYHCAALVSFDKKDFKNLIPINRRGTENIVNVCLAKNVSKLCYVSSTAALGNGDHPIVETTPWKNGPDISGYSVSKYSAEKEVWRGIEEGLNAVIVNPCVIFGAGNWNDSSLAIFKTVNGGVNYYPPGANATVDARDVAEIMLRLMESPISAERFLCIGSNQSFYELIAEIATQLGRKTPKKEARKWMVNLIRNTTGFLLFFLGRRPVISKDTMENLFAKRVYSNEKVKHTLHFEFRDLKEQVRNAIAGKLS